MAYIPGPNGGRINATIGGNTAGAGALVSSGTLTLAGGNNVTLSQAGNAVTISAGAAGGANSFGMSNLGNTAGTTGVVSGSALQYYLAGGNNVTLSQSLNGSSGTLTISAANQSNQTVGLYGLGNTTQNSSTTLDARSLSFNGLGNISVGYSNGSIQLSGSGGGGGVALYDGANSISSGTARFSNSNGVSFGINGQTITGGVGLQMNVLNNTTGGSSTATLNATGINFSNYGAISGGFTGSTMQLSVPATSSLSATGAVGISTNGSTISIGAPQNGTISNWEPTPIQNGSLVTGTQMGNGTINFIKLQVPAYVSATQLLALASISLSSSSNSSHAGAISLYAGLYTANGSTLSLITASSGSAANSWSNTSNNSMASVSGLRGLTAPVSVSMQPGMYWLGFMSRTSTTNANWFTASNVMFQHTANTDLTYQGTIGVAANATLGVQEGVGYYSASSTNLPSSAAMSNITQSALSLVSAPYLVFKNQTW